MNSAYQQAPSSKQSVLNGVTSGRYEDEHAPAISITLNGIFDKDGKFLNINGDIVENNLFGSFVRLKASDGQCYWYRLSVV